MGNLEGKRAVVSGAGAGIGRAIALALAGQGASVAIMDLDTAAASVVAAEITSAGGSAFPVRASVADPDEVRAAFSQIDEQMGGVDILVNNAGISGNRPTLELTDDDWKRTVSVNLDGVFYCAREAGRRMAAQGSGAIVNIGSIYSIVAAPRRLHYCATKAAVEMMTRSLAIEWAELGIRVNGVAPGYVQTALLEDLARSGRVDVEAIRRRVPQKRLAEVEEVADAVLYLCEPRSSHITGQMLAVDGGWTAYGFV